MSQPRVIARHKTHTHGMNGARASARIDGVNDVNSSAVAHTLTACTRCRQRKTRCDPNLPKCGPCERTNSVCEYFDSTKGHVVNRNYVIYLQHKVRDLEEELAKVENEDYTDDPETMMRSANVRMQDDREAKYLGPSSGIAITRLVMQLAKQFTESKSIKDIVPDASARHAKDLYGQEQAKPTSKVYPVTSNVAAPDLPDRGLTQILVQLYKLKVQPLYPALHEPTLDADIEAVYRDTQRATPFQNFVTRMVIAISLQKMDTQYAGLADSFYLAALIFLDQCVRPMDMKTLQCFALMAEYSLLTPTRTAIYYVIGIAIRLVQALGYNEEKTIMRGKGEARANALEIDMRRRLFWCVWVMDAGLAHSLGRPSSLATGMDHIDVGFFEMCEDQYISADGIDPVAQPTLKKWVAIHFFKMRLLQLEIRRKLYQRKRPEPKDNDDPWFVEMDAKMKAWRDAVPSEDVGQAVDKSWFVVRYNTIVVFLYRPSPQIPRPSLNAAQECFEACEYNIQIQKEQILTKTVDLTWIFTQSIFMAINTMLWSLSYVEVRKKHSRSKVEENMQIAMQCIQFASERWPGVASAIQLYQNLITAVLRIYEKDDDVPISAVTPSDAATPPPPFADRSSTSPATVSSNSVPTPEERSAAPFGYIDQQHRRSVEQPPPMPYQPENDSPTSQTPHAHPQSNIPPVPVAQTSQATEVPYYNPVNDNSQSFQTYDLNNQWSHLPEFSADLTVPGWNHAYPADGQNQIPFASGGFGENTHPYFDPTSMPMPQNFDMPITNDQYMQPFWDDGSLWNNGINSMQQQELMQTLQASGMEDIQHMISDSVAAMTPKPGRS